MTVSVHIPGQHMASVRQIIGQWRKRTGLLVGVVAPAGIVSLGRDKALFPAVAAGPVFARAMATPGETNALSR